MLERDDRCWAWLLIRRENLERKRDGHPTCIQSLVSGGADCPGRASAVTIAWLARDGIESTTYSLLLLGISWGPKATRHAPTKRVRPLVYQIEFRLTQCWPLIDWYVL